MLDYYKAKTHNKYIIHIASPTSHFFFYFELNHTTNVVLKVEIRTET